MLRKQAKTPARITARGELMFWWVKLLIGIGVAALVIIVVALIVKVYNKLVDSKEKVKNGWSQIDVQLRRRFDLIPPHTKRRLWRTLRCGVAA